MNHVMVISITTTGFVNAFNNVAKHKDEESPYAEWSTLQIF